MDVPDRLASFLHGPGCPVAISEAATYAGDVADLGRHEPRGRLVWHRHATSFERLLLVWTGIALDTRTPCFTRVSFAPHPGRSGSTAPVRRRSWAVARGLVCEDSGDAVSGRDQHDDVISDDQRERGAVQ